VAYITLDFETFYGTKYSLTSLSYEEYIHDPRFKVHGVGIKIDNQPTTYYPEQQVYDALQALFGAPNAHTLICHNIMFDGAILSWHYGMRAKTYWCTQAMSRGLYPQERANLANLAERLWPDDPSMRKGKELESFKDVQTLDAEQQARMGAYCRQDVDLTFAAALKMHAMLPDEELESIDWVSHQFIHPVIEVDRPLLEQFLVEHRAERARVIAASGTTQEVLASNMKFAAWLLATHEIEIPLILSPTPKDPENQKLPLSKQDKEFINLQLDHPELEYVWVARKAATSNIAETRAERILLHSRLNGGKLAVPISYYAAHTGRYGGTNKINVQNFQAGSAHRRALKAPAGYKIGVRDLSNIEGRLSAWFARQVDKCQAFARGEDLYNKIASEIYGRPIDRKRVAIHPETGEEFEPDAQEGFVGKTCLAEGSLVLTNSGWKPVETIKLSDQLWDGENWVSHDGMIANGIKETLNLSGLWLTPDHLVLCGTDWKESQYLVQDKNALCQALGTAMGTLQLPGTSGANGVELNPSSYAATAVSMNISSILKTLSYSNLRDALSARAKQVLKSVTGCTPLRWQTTLIERGYLTDFPPQSLGAITRGKISGRDVITPIEASRYVKLGGTIDALFYYTCKHCQDGIARTWTWTELTMIAGMNRAISGLSRGRKTATTDGPSSNSNNACQNSKQSANVYDILSVGPNNRFYALTEQGPVVVHNCELGLGYRMGPPKLRHTFLVGGRNEQRVFFTLEDCQHFVRTYRQLNDKIAECWVIGDRMIEHMLQKDEQPIKWRCLEVGYRYIKLPNGMYLTYPKLRRVEDERGNMSVVYWNGKHDTHIHGGKLMENIIQALARIIMEHGRRLACKELAKQEDPNVRIAMSVHDELVAVLKAERAQQDLEMIDACMRELPDWANDGLLVLATAGGIDDCYSK